MSQGRPRRKTSIELLDEQLEQNKDEVNSINMQSEVSTKRKGGLKR